MDTHRREYRLRPKKLHVKHVVRIGPIDPISPRRYTLTHSDITGEILLSVKKSTRMRQTDLLGMLSFFEKHASIKIVIFEIC